MATVLDLVKHYQHAIEKYPNDEQKVLKSIDKLFHLDVTVQHLQETGVGRTVNALRKESGDVGHAARALVYKWKLMVAAEESDQDGDHNTDTTAYNGHENGKDSDDNSKQHHSRNKYDHYEKHNANVKSEQKELNGNSSGGKRRHQSSEDEEPDVKKSRNSGQTNHYHDNHKRKSTVQVKKEPMSEDESDDTEHSQSEDSDSDASESSRDEEDRKIKKEIKQEPTENYKSTSSKHLSSQKSSRSPDHKRESSSSKKTHESEKHRHHSSERMDRHSSEKQSTKIKYHSSDKHKSSKEKDKNDKNSKSESSSSEKDKKQKEDSKSSSKHKHSSDKHKSSNSDNSSEKHKSQNEKHSSKSEKHKSSSHSQKSDKEKHKSTSENSEEKHKSKHSSSSKEKHRSSSKDKSKDRSSSSKEKTEGSKENHHSHKSEKKQTSSSESKSKHSDSKHKSDKNEERSNETKSKHKSSSSSSSHKSKSSSSKSKEEVPKKRNETNSSADSDDGIDCGSGASFAEALGMVSPAKPKKKTAPTKEFGTSGSMNKDLSPASLLAPTAKLAPLPLPLSLPLEISALPDISPNYKPRPPPKLMPHFTEEEALSSVISSKNQRTKVYSGNKVIGKIPSLYEMCVQILQEHIDALEYTGGVPYDILKPVVDRATPQQLFLLEHYNPYLMEDTDHLWEKFCLKNFRNKQRKEMETWREMYMRCQEEQEHRLKSLTANIKMTQEAKKAPIKQTKMAYVDSVVKPPRNIARKQALHGTAHAASASPAARVASLAAAPNVLRGNTRPTPTAAVSASSFKPKKAPLMQKALQFMRGRKR